MTQRRPRTRLLWSLVSALVTALATVVLAEDALVLSLTQSTGGALLVTWSFSSSWLGSNNTVENIQRFNVFLNNALVGQVASKTTSYDFYGLKSRTTYAARVEGVLVDANAPALTSNELVVTTPATSRPGTPPPPQLVAAGGGYLRVNTTLPMDTGGASITTILLTLRSLVDTSSWSFSNVVGDPIFTIYGLNAKTSYQIRAYVMNEAGLYSILSDELSTSTLSVENPSSCPAPTVVNSTGGSVALRLNPPVDDGGSRIRGYVVYMSVNGSSLFQEVANTIASVEVNVVEIRRLPGLSTQPLRPLSRYDFKAVAINVADVCLPSNPLGVTGEVVTAWTTAASLPEAPPAPYFLTSTGGMVTIQLLMPGNMRGAELKGFSIKVNDSLLATIAVNTEVAYSVPSLMALQNYSVQSAVVTNLGTTDWSAEAVIVTSPPSSPSAPSNVTVNNVTASQATIRWTVPNDTGGVDITAYILTLTSPVTGSIKINTPLSPFYRLTTLLADTVYSVKVSALNAIGRTSSSVGSKSISFQTLPPALPSEPTHVRGVSTSGGAIEITWQRPLASGGYPYEALVYNATLFGVSPCFNASSNASRCGSCNLVRLRTGDDVYEHTSDNITCIPPAAADCPDGTSSCCITVPNSTAGSGLLCSQISRMLRYRIITKGSTMTSFQGLNHSSTYYAGVQTINAVGRSQFSPIYSLRTRSQTAPGYPIRLRQVNATGGSVSLTWSAPQDTGGTSISGYRVYRDYRLLTPQPVLPPFQDCGSDLRAQTQYIYGVVAINASNFEGSMSSILVSMPKVSVPRPINSLSLVARTVSWMNVTVNPSCDGGGSSAISYQYLLRQDNNTIGSGVFACCNLVLTGLAISQGYDVNVRAMNEAGTTDWINATFSTTKGVPNVPAWRLVRANTYSLLLSPTSNITIDLEIVTLIVEVYLNEQLKHEVALPCDTVVAPGARSCPQSFRIASLSPNTTYRVATIADGPFGTSDWSSQTFKTSNESIGVVEFEASRYTGFCGGIVNITARRVGGTAGPLSVVLNVSQPESVFLRCECSGALGCSCSLLNGTAGLTALPGTLFFEDGQEIQTAQVALWKDDPRFPQATSVLLAVVGPSNVIGVQSQAIVQVSPSLQSGFATFVSTKTVVWENASFVDVNVVRVNGSSGTLSFEIETFDINGITGKHYVSLSRTAAFADRQTLITFRVEIIDNSYYEGTREFGLRIRNRLSSSLFSRNTYSASVVTRHISIRDDETSSMTLPAIPTAVQITRATGGELEIGWTMPNETSIVSGFLVRASTPRSGTERIVLYNTTSPSSFVVSLLTPQTLYRIQVAAWNMYGVSDFSATALALTLAPSPPSAPRNFSSLNSRGSSLDLSWTSPRDKGGSNISGYVLWKLNDGGDFEYLANVSGHTTRFTVEGLSALRTYSFFIAASTSTHVASVSGALANTTATTSAPTTPSKPPAPILIGAPTAGTLSFLIPDPSDLGGTDVTDYSLLLRPLPIDAPITANTTQNDLSFQVVCTASTPWTNNSFARSCTIYTLLAGTSYEAYVVLYNVVGASPPGDRAVARTSSTAELPTAPTNLRASRVTAGSIYLSWDLPLDLGGVADVLGYTVFQREGDAFSDYFVVYDGQGSTNREVALKGLRRQSTYSYAVVAQTAASYCVGLKTQRMTEFLTVTTLSYSPLGPPQSVVKIRATGGSITIGWSPPDDLAGVPLSGYLVELMSEDETTSVILTPDPLSPDMLQYTHYNLSEQTSYRYAVTANNEGGPSQRSAIVVIVTTSCTVPDSVQNLHFVEASGGRITIAFNPPLDAGGRSILYYQVTRSGASSISFTVASTSFTDTRGLAARSQYLYAVRAYNGLFYGQPTYVWTNTGEPSPPAPPVIVSVEAFGGKLNVSWANPEDTGGVPITQYLIYLFDEIGTNRIDGYEGISAAHEFGSLTANTMHVLIASAVNEAGQGGTVQYNISTSDVDLPGPPPAPTASEILGGSMSLTVYTPSYTGGGDIVLSLHNGTRVIYTFAQGEFFTLVKGLVAMTEYRFHAIANNSRGQTSGVELVVSTGEVSTPSGVSTVQLVDRSFDRLIVSWPPVEDTGGDSSLQYEVTYFLCDSNGTALAASQVVMVTTNRAVISSLDTSSSYCVSVRPKTSSGLYGAGSPNGIFTTEEPFAGRITAELPEILMREDSGEVSIPVLRVDGSYGDSDYYYETLDETAASGVKYYASNGTVTMSSGMKSGSILIMLQNDNVYNPNTTFLVLVRDVTTQTTTQTRVVLLDDGDAGFISFAAPQYSFIESSGIVYLRITRNGGNSPEAVIEPYVISTRTELATRFSFVDASLTFREGDTFKDLGVKIEDDSTFQFWPDTEIIGLRVLSGGPWMGDYQSTNLTVLDDGDMSPPKEATNLRLVSATGGSVVVQWVPPLDQGGANVKLSYMLEFKAGQQIVLETSVSTDTAVVYGLAASTTYTVSVRAANNAGTGLSGLRLLLSTTIATPPTAPQNLDVIAASSSTLLLTWDPPRDSGGSPIVGYMIFNVSSDGSFVQFPSVSCILPTLCTVNGLAALTSYAIRIRASSSLVSNAGELSPLVVFTTSTPNVPETPPLANVTWVSAGAMTIKMFNPVNVGGSDVHQYRLFIRGPSDLDFVQIYQGSDDSYSVYRLDKRSTYEIKYQAVNSVGASAFSPILGYQTLERSLASAPLNVSVVSATGGAIQLTWLEPLDVGARAITGYSVMMRSPWPGSAEVVAYDGRGDPTTTGILYGLNASTSYLVYVIAYTEVSNCYASTELAKSVPIQANTTAPTLPVPAPILTLVRYTGGIVEATWSPPRDTGGVPITGYMLLLLTPTGGIPIYSILGSGSRSFVHNDLIESTVYTYAVRANTSVGDSPLSNPLVVKTSVATAPSAPLNLRQGEYVTGGAIQITWERPIDTGGQPLRAFWIYRDSAIIAQNVAPTDRVFLDKQNLKAATAYEYTIRAVSWSTMGSELISAVTASTTAATKPQGPLLLSNTTGASFIIVHWSPDLDTGGLPVLKYDAKLFKGSSSVEFHTGQDISYRFTRLTALTNYTLQLIAYNQIGASETLTTSIVTLPVALPDAPPAPLAVVVFGGNLTVEVSVPTDTGGAAITVLRLYEVKLGLVGSMNLTNDAQKARYTIFGLLKNTSYSMTATAVNSLGEGRASSPVSVRTTNTNAPGLIKAAPSLSAATGTTITITWVAPADSGGDSSLTYEVRFTEGVNSMTAISVTREFKATGLKYNTAYTMVVRVVNSAGKSDWSPAVSATTLPDAAGEFNLGSTSLGVLENAGTISLVVTRVNGLSGTVTVGYNVSSNDTHPATLGKDFALATNSLKSSGFITFNPLQTTTSISVTILNDDRFESPDEQFIVQLTNVTLVSTTGTVLPPKLGVNATMGVTIHDDGDAGSFRFSASEYRVSEDAVSFLVPILREDGKNTRVNLSLEFSDGTATGDRDYRRLVTPVVFEDGQTNSTLRVFIINDKTYEHPDENFTIRILPPAAGTVKQGLATVTILDDGDLSVPAVPPAPRPVSTTGGSITLQLSLPVHNGSATAQLTNFTVRVVNSLTAAAFTVVTPLTTTVTIGHLQAQQLYNFSVAVNNSFGQSPFSSAVALVTTQQTLPGPVASITRVGSTGGSLQLEWSPPEDTGGVPITKYRVYSISSQGIPMLVADIPQAILTTTIKNLESNTTYRFAVQAGNAVLAPEFAHGWGAIGPAFVFITPSASLPAPTEISKDAVGNVTGGAITIGWTRPSDTGGAPLLGFDVYARNASSMFKLAGRVPNPDSSMMMITGLYAASWYEIFVLAVNRVQNLSLAGLVSCVSGSSVLLTTHDLSKSVPTHAVLAVDTTVFVLGNMTNATKGTLPLTFPYTGSSISKLPASVIGYAAHFANLSTTAPSIPAAPPQVELVSATGGAIAFRVKSPGDTGGVPIDDFKVFVNDKEQAEENVRKQWVQTSHLMKSLTVRVNKLNPETGYAIKVVAVNAISVCKPGEEEASPVATFQTTKVSRPEPPQISSQYITGGGMSLVLLDPFDTGGRAIMRYWLYMTTNLVMNDWRLVFSSAGTNGTERSVAQIAGLLPTTAYLFKASVSNGAYVSPNTTVANISTSVVSAPGQCSEPRRHAETGGMITVVWDDPLDNGGTDVKSFRVSISLADDEDGTSKRTFMTSSHNYTFYRLTAATEYVFSVSAINDRGEGPNGLPATISTRSEGTAPRGPISVTVLGSTGGAAIISFNEPVDFGGTPREMMKYNVLVDGDHTLTLNYAQIVDMLKATSSSQTQRRLATASGVTVGGLDPLSLYNIQIQAVNDYDSGNLSTPSSAATTAATLPSAPQDLVARTITGGSIGLNWSAPADTGGLPLLDYVVYRSTSQGGAFSEVCRSNTTECKVTSLRAGTSYWFYLVVSNVQGSSPQSPTVMIATTDETIPGTPDKVRVVSVSHDTINIEWTPPVDDGGAAIVSYTVAIKDTILGPLPSIVVVTPTAQITNLTVSTEYSVTVNAINALQRVSAFSIPRIVTTSSGMNVSVVPTISCVSSSAISLVWYVYPTATQYRVYQNGTIVYTGASTDFVDNPPPVAIDTPLEYAIEAEIGGSWTGLLSAPATARTHNADADLGGLHSKCSGSFGYIRQLNYQPNTEASWELVPSSSFSTLTLEFSTFDLECDHDKLRIEKAETNELIWQGGCRRSGTFIVQAGSNVRVIFTSDGSVNNRGFLLYYETDRFSLDSTKTRVPPPSSPSGVTCSSHGRRQDDGSCKCSVGFTGEDCSNHIVCCSDPSRCTHAVCSRPSSQVIVVSDEFGDDTNGTGAMMNASENGTTSKAVKTLSKAIGIAADGDFILVYPGEYKGALNRDLQVGSRKDLSIGSLKGYKWTSINCESSGRALQVTSSSLTIQGLTIRNGLSASTSDGGALWVSDASLVMRDVLFLRGSSTRHGGCVASIRSNVTMVASSIDSCSAASGEGGGLFLVDSKLSFDQSNVTTCSASNGAGISLDGSSSVAGINEAVVRKCSASVDGGGLSVRGQATLSGLAIAENEAVRGGGVISMDGSKVTFQQCSITKNKASAHGGGIAVVGTVVVQGTKTKITENTAATNGGGVFVQGSQVSIELWAANDTSMLSLIMKNTAASGGGLYVTGTELSLRGVAIQNGTASGNGGGIAVWGSRVALGYISVSSNVAARSGGGLFVTNSHVSSSGVVTVDYNTAQTDGGGFVLDNSELHGVDITILRNTAAVRGGGVHFEGVAVLSGATVTSCVADRGAGGYLNQATVSFDTVTIDNCAAATVGGGLAMSASSMTIVSSTIENSRAIMGGGVHAVGNCAIEGDLRVASSSAIENGGAIYATDQVRLKHMTIQDSIAKQGAGLFTSNAGVIAQNVSVERCHALQAGGGWAAESTKLQLKDTMMAGHTSDNFGGGLMLKLSTVEYDNVTIASSTAKIGGGIYLVDSTIVPSPLAVSSIESANVSGNRAQLEGGNLFINGSATLLGLAINDGFAEAYGGGVAMSQANVTITNCTLSTNSAGDRGGGLSLRSGSRCDLITSLILENVATNGGGGGSIRDSIINYDASILELNSAFNGGCFIIEGISKLLPIDALKPSIINTSRALAPGSVGPWGNGSAIYVMPASDVEVAGLLVYKGHASRGGVYVNKATLDMNSMQFVYNKATDGAALYATTKSAARLTDSQFYANEAAANGGAVYVEGLDSGRSLVHITNCEFTDNYAKSTGGAMSMTHTTALLNATHFQNNTIDGSDGGGAAVAALSSGNLTFTLCSFLNNTVRSENGKGGALYFLSDTRVFVWNSTLVGYSNGRIAREGGSVYINGKTSELTMIDSEVAHGQAFAGGGIYASLAKLFLVRSTVRDNYAYGFGSGVYIDSGEAELNDCMIQDNTAYYDGGGVFVKGKSTLKINASAFTRNQVLDGGGGMYVAPGGGAMVSVDSTNFTGNLNRGLGSGIFIGRKNVMTVSSSQFVANGGATTEGGGGLYAVDAQVVVTKTEFTRNRATRGAAIELSRDAKLTMSGSEMLFNSAAIWGGAMYLSVRATASIQMSLLNGNNATTGGAVYLVGSSKLTLRDVGIKDNVALSFGGGITLIGRASLDAATISFSSNSAYTGGAVSVTQNATAVIKASAFDSNSARDFGGGVYIDSLIRKEEKPIEIQAMKATNNSAVAGIDVYWVFHPAYEFFCQSCISTTTTSGRIQIATSPASISAGWWPSTVTSGISLGIAKPNWQNPRLQPTGPTNQTNAGSNVGGDASLPPAIRRLASSSSSSFSGPGSIDAATLAAISSDSSLTSPYESMLWPTMVARDFYGAIAAHDNATQCLASKLTSEEDEFLFYPASPVEIDRGYITFSDAKIASSSRPTPFQLHVTCSLANDVPRNMSIEITVASCNPGYENTDGVCVVCKKGTYSFDGVKCHPCPRGATCEQMDEFKTLIGVTIPSRAEGFFIYDSRQSYLEANCLDPSKWDAGDPCRSVSGSPNMTYRLQTCSKRQNFESYWPGKRIFACLATMEYYACDTRSACTEDNATIARLLTGVEELTRLPQCEEGYGSVTCATCLSGYYKVSNGTCKLCSDPKDPAVERMTALLAMVPLGFGIIALVLVWYYFSNATESEIMKQARAARKFQIYDPHLRPQSVVLAASAYVRERVSDMMKRAGQKFIRRRERHLFNIVPRAASVPAFRAEKFKIMLAFFQIFGGFKKLYEIPWPNQMSRLMDIFSIADFSLVDTTGIECFIQKNYFSNYRLSLIAVLILLFVTAMLLSWGVVRYRVKLSSLPRHCVRCGLPVFQMLRRKPQTIVRRATMVSMLRIQHKQREDRLRKRSFITRAKGTVTDKAENLLTRFKSWWSKTRAGKALERFIVFTQLPASASQHYPECPTSQQIESEVLAMVVRSNLRLWRARVRLRLNYQTFQNKCIKLFFWVFLFFYPELSQRVVGMFYCDEIGKKYYMNRDKSQLCYEGVWLYYLPLTMFLLVVWVAGVPLLFWTIIFLKRRHGVDDKLLLLEDPSNQQLKARLVQEMRDDLIDRGVFVEEEALKTYEKDMMAEFLRNKKLNEPSMIAQVGFIYHSYRTQFWWFEVWDLGRKLFLNCVIGLLAKTGANRIIAGLIVLLIYLSVMLFYQPYKERSDSALAGVTQIQLFVTLFCGLILKMGSLHLEDSVVSMLTYAVFFSNVGTMTYAIFSIVFEKLNGARKARRRAREEHRRAIQNHVRKLWFKAYGYAFTEVYFRDRTIRPMPIQVILELARRDREARQLDEVDTHLGRSFQISDEREPNEVTLSQIDLDLPRPSDVVSPRSAPSSQRSLKDGDASRHSSSPDSCDSGEPQETPAEMPYRMDAESETKDNQGDEEVQDTNL